VVKWLEDLVLLLESVELDEILLDQQRIWPEFQFAP